MKEKFLAVSVLAIYIFLQIGSSFRHESRFHGNVGCRSLSCATFSPINSKASAQVFSRCSTELYLADRLYHRDPYSEKSKLILDDIDQILEAIYIFKQIYNDVAIPIKFDVPSTDPWPSHLHGLRLGRRLEKILSTPEFFDDHPDYVNEMVKLGFVPSLDSLVDDWTVIFEALKAYKRIFDDMRVPAKFVVPDEEPWPRLTRSMKLGIKVAAIRSAGRYIKDHRERKAELDALGFEWRLRDHTHKQQLGDEQFDQVYDALVYYKKCINDDLNIPVDFVVPDGEGWPEETWGLSLGSLVLAIREKEKFVFGRTDRVRRLNKLGFQWEENKRDQYSKKRFDIVYSALVVYKELYSDLYVPQSFVVPTEQPWPEETWGLKLGARVNAIRAQGTLVTNSAERREKLENLGFIWELPQPKKKKKNSDVAVEIFSDDEGEDFDFSENEIKVGKKIDTRLLGNSRYDASIAQVAEVDESEKKRVNRISSYSSRFLGESNIPMTFDPSRMFEPLSYREISAETMREYILSREYSDDPDVREVAHFEGYLSPDMFHKLSIREIPEEDISAMKNIGYRILEFGEFNWETFLEALKIYRNAYGSLEVPYNFTIDESVIAEGIGFTYRFENMPLGDFVQGVRIGDIDGLEDVERREILDALGFDWGNKDVYIRFRFYPMLLGLKVYRHLYEFPLPPTDFVVPDDSQWPYWMCGMPLGLWTTICRVQQKMLAEHYPERKDMLHALEFLWWIPPGKIPSKYYEPVS